MPGNQGFPYPGYVNVTITLDDDLVKKARKIAVDRDTTLTGLIRQHLEDLVKDDPESGRRQRELEALQGSFERLQVRVGKRTWTRADLHERR